MNSCLRSFDTGYFKSSKAQGSTKCSVSVISSNKDDQNNLQIFAKLEYFDSESKSETCVQTNGIELLVGVDC